LKGKEASRKRYTETLLIILAALAIFLLVYSPHFANRFPYHVDEWHHISEAAKLRQGEYSGGTFGYRAGFHIFLLILSFAFNLVAVYRFLPAVWAVFSALVLFFAVNRKTSNFWIALFAMVFFASIKSNVNITGLWFFTPLSFSIPFIFLYVYFLTEGIEKQDKKSILISLGIMLFVLFVHPISVLFAAPFLLIYALMHLDYIKKEYKFFSAFLAIPVSGLLFYSYMKKISIIKAIGSLIKELQFKYGWGVLETSNSFFELYSLIGYLLAVIGIITIFMFSKEIRKYLIYVLWPATVLVLIIIYKLTGISFLSPYQRNLYYFVISLPLLSAFGLYLILEKIKKLKIPYKKIISALLIIIIVFFAFKSYYDLPENLKLYKIIDENDYEALLFLSQYPKSTVMANHIISTAIYPASGHDTVAQLFFYGNINETKRFFSSETCKEKQELLDKYDVKYILSEQEIDCDWNLIYDKENYIYEVN